MTEQEYEEMRDYMEELVMNHEKLKNKGALNVFNEKEWYPTVTDLENYGATQHPENFKEILFYIAADPFAESKSDDEEYPKSVELCGKLLEEMIV